jgi:hypothetical protein
MRVKREGVAPKWKSVTQFKLSNGGGASGEIGLWENKIQHDGEYD